MIFSDRLLIKEFETVEIKNTSFKGELFRDGDLFFLKPSTYMNLSGDSISAVKNFFKIEDTVIIHDDLDLPFGAIRFKVGGGTGGHNGLKSLDNFTKESAIRVRMGIGKPVDCSISSYVLSKYSDDEMSCFSEWVELSKRATLEIIKGDWNRVASIHSKKSATVFCNN